MNWWECKFNRGYIKIKKVCKRMNIKIRKALAPSVQYRQEEFILFSKNANISITKWAKVPKKRHYKLIVVMLDPASLKKFFLLNEPVLLLMGIIITYSKYDSTTPNS